MELGVSRRLGNFLGHHGRLEGNGGAGVQCGTLWKDGGTRGAWGLCSKLRSTEEDWRILWEAEQHCEG